MVMKFMPQMVTFCGTLFLSGSEGVKLKIESFIVLTEQYS